jgi:hypothetical protein
MAAATMGSSKIFPHRGHVRGPGVRAGGVLHSTSIGAPEVNLVELVRHLGESFPALSTQ